MLFIIKAGEAQLMRVLLTTILCHSGLMTHVRDLVRYLEGQGVEVAVAYKKGEFLSEGRRTTVVVTLVNITIVFLKLQMS